MRASLVLLVALAACSDSSGPHQIPVLTTQLSSSAVGYEDVLTVTLTASNPTDTTLHLSSTGVDAEIKVQGQWTAGTVDFVGSPSLDTLSLASGAGAPVGSVGVVFVPQVRIDAEYFKLAAGTYNVRGCYFPSETTGPQGGIVTPICGNAVSITLGS